MFTAADRAFLRAILSDPAELTAWLVYADRLEEHDNPAHAEFLRLMARHGQPQWDTVEERLQERRATLDPNWVAVFDRPKIENCEPAFRFQCPKQWEHLKVLNEPAVRYCSACDQTVHYCHTLDEARRHAQQGHCVAVRLGVLRHPGDLARNSGEVLTNITGLMSPDVDFTPPQPPRRPWWKFW